MIYCPLFAAGSVTITRASKAFHENTKKALYQHGVYRIRLLANFACTRVMLWMSLLRESGPTNPYCSSLLRMLRTHLLTLLRTYRLL